ncbi:DUF1801 domain-containing protein [Candidatus Poribacteria bacterium]|nr:DUF1801 domain-containing protein [Candidatus Poribacteria bacterium]
MPATTKPRTVDDYIAAQGARWRPVLEALRALVRKAAPAAGEAIKWGMPTYAQNGLLCYLSVTKNHVLLGFYRGVELHDPGGLLEGTGKGMRHVKVRSAADIRKRCFANWVKQAVELNAADGGKGAAMRRG